MARLSARVAVPRPRARGRRARARAVERAVEIFWDVDNVRPRASTVDVVIERLIDAGRAFGRVDAVRAYANAATIDRCDVEDALKARARAWTLDVCSTTAVDGADRKLGGDVATYARGANGDGFRFTTTRWEVENEGDAAGAAWREVEAMWRRRAREARDGLPMRDDARDAVEAITRGRTRVALVVTSDNDMRVAMDYAAANGVCVVALGTMSPSVGGRRSMKTKSGRATAKSAGREWMTKEYWNALKMECERRELSRLSLLQSCDGALVWDPSREFDGHAGQVVGVWHPGRASIGRWYFAH